MFIMKILTVSFTLCTILAISQAGPINITTSLDGGLCAHKKQSCTNLIGSFCPQCDANGNFLPQQCSGSTGYCWCVNTMTGNEIPNTKTPPGVIPVNCMKKDCPEGWFQFGHRCFSFISSPKTWTEAQIYCQFDGGNLASIHSEEENQFLQALTRGNTHDFPETWIGGTDAIQPDIWMWIDGSKFYYENWCSSNNHDDHDDTDSQDHDDSSEHDSHDDSDDHDHDNSSHHDNHEDSDDHDHDNSSHHDNHDDSDDHDHDNSSHHDNHDDSDDHDHDNSSHHDNHDDSNDHDDHDTDDHDHSNNTSDHDRHDDTDEHDDQDNNSSHDDSDDHDDHHDNDDHHSHNKKTSSCLRMNCHYKMKWCSAACNDAFPFVCSRTI